MAMRTMHVLALGATLGAIGTTGCFQPQNDCGRAHDCPLGNGTGGGVPVACDPSQNTDPVADSCGVFVSAMGDDGNAGTKEKPLKTIGAALAKGAVVYACAGPMPFNEAVTVPAGVAIYGGIDCTSWGYVGDKIKTAITAGPGQVPMTLSMGLGAKLSDLHVTAAPTMDPGGSSIAVV